VLVGGYWDYPLEQRGLVFAPVYFPRTYWYDDPYYCYYPRNVITVTFVTDSFFIGPCHHHYYYGAYYGPQWHNAGFVAWVDFGPRCHDPIFCYYKYEYRNDPGWHARMVVTYNQRFTGQLAPPAKIVNNNTYVIHNTVINNTTVVNNVNMKGPVQVVGLQGQAAPKVPKLQAISAAEVQKQVAASKSLQAAVKNRQQLETQYAKQPGGPATGGKAMSFSVNQFKLPAQATTAPKAPAPALPGVNAAPKVTTPNVGAAAKITQPTTPPTPTPTPKVTTPTPLPTPKAITPVTPTPTPKVTTPITPTQPKVTPMPPKTTPVPPKGGPPAPDHKKDPPKGHISMNGVDQGSHPPVARGVVSAWRVTQRPVITPGASMVLLPGSKLRGTRFPLA
jgi:hypothetical protein